MAGGRQRHCLGVGVFFAVQAGACRDGRRVDDRAGFSAACFGGHCIYRRAHRIRVRFDILALVVRDRGVAGFGLGPGEVHELPVMAGGGQHDRLGLGVFFAVQAGFRRDGGRVDGLARGFAGRVIGLGRDDRVHRLRVLFVVLALVVGDCGVTVGVIAGPGEVHKLPVVAGGGQHDRLGLGVLFAVQAGFRRDGGRVDGLARGFTGRIIGLGRDDRAYRIRVSGIVLALVVGNCGVAGFGLDPGEAGELPVVADGGQVDVLGVGVLLAVQAAGCRDLCGVFGRAGDLAAGFDRFDRDVRVYRSGLGRVGGADVVGDGGGVAVFIVTGPGEVHELPNQGLEVDFDDDVVVRHLEAFGGQGLDEFGAVFAVRSPQFDTVEFVVFGRRVNDGDIHQARRGDGGRLAAVADQEGGAVAFRDFDGRQVVLRNVEVTAERLPAAVRIAGRAEVDGDGTGVVGIDDVVARHTVVVMLRARIIVAVVSHAADRAHDLDLIVLGQRGRQAVFSRLVRVHGKGVVFIDLPVGHAADQVEAFDRSPLRNDGHVFRRHGLRNFGIPAREGEERLGRVLGRSFDRIAVSGCDGGKRSLVAFVGQEGDRVFVDLPSGRQGQILSHRRCEVERGLAVLFEPAQERIAFFDRIFRFLGRGPLADGLRIRRRDAIFRDEGHDDRLEQFVNALGLRGDPQVAFRNGPLVAFGQDVAVFRAGAAGLLIHEHLDAGGGVEYDVPADHHILIDVDVAVGNAVVAVERAALQVEGAGRCRVDRRAEVGPPVAAGRCCVRRVFAAVHRNGRRRRGVVGADRSEMRGNGRAIAVFRSEDGRAAVQDVHAVHAVGALAGGGDRAVFDRQLAAVDADHDFTVECRAVSRAGDLAVAGNRQIAGRRYRDHVGLGGADFLPVQVERDGLVNDQLVFLNVLQQDDRVAVLCRRDGGRQCAVRGGLAVSRDGGDRFADRVDAGFFGLDPRVSFRQRAGVAFRLDAAVGRAGGTGLLVDEYVDAGGGVEDHVAPDHHILVDVGVAVGNAVVAVERAALQFEGAGSRRVDRRAEVIPPLIVGRRRVRRVFAAVHRNGRRRRGVVGTDRSEVRGNGRAVAVRGAEDRRAVLQDVHAVHAVGTLAGGGQRTVFNSQFAAGDVDQSVAVECRAVGRAGDPAVAGDRQIAVSRHRKHAGLGGAEFVPVQIKRDRLADFKLIFLNILQQDDRIAGLCRRDGFRQRRIIRVVDPGDVLEPSRGDRDVFLDHRIFKVKQLIIRTVPAEEGVAFPYRGRLGSLAAPVEDLVGDVGAAGLIEGHRHFDPGPVDDVDHVARDSLFHFGDPGVRRIEFVAFPGDRAQVALERRRRLAVLDVISFEDVAEAVGIDDLLRNAFPGRQIDDVGSFDRRVDALDLGALLQPAVEDIVLFDGIRDRRGRLVQDGIQCGLLAVHVVDDLGLPPGGQRDGFRHERSEVIGGFRIRQEPADKGEAGLRGRIRGLFDGGVPGDLHDRDVAVVVLVVRVEGDVDRIVQFVHAGVFFTFRDLHQDLVIRYADVRLLAVVGEVAAVDEAGQGLVACHRVGGYGRGVVGDEAAAGNIGDRRAVRIVAGLHDQRVAGRVSAVAVVAVVSCRAGGVQRAAVDIHGTALLVDRRRAADRAAGDRQRAGIGLVDGDVFRGGNGAAADRDGVIVAGVAAGADRRSVAAGGADGAVSDHQAGSAHDVDRVGIIFRCGYGAAADRYGGAGIGIDPHAAGGFQDAGFQNESRAVLHEGRDAADDLAAADGILERQRRAAAYRVEERIAVTAQGVAGEVDRDGFPDLDPGGDFDVFEDLDGVAVDGYCYGSFQRAEQSGADLGYRVTDRPQVLADLDGRLAFHDEVIIRLAVEETVADLERGVFRSGDLGNVAGIVAVGDDKRTFVSNLSVLAEDKRLAGRNAVAFAHDGGSACAVFQADAVAIRYSRFESVADEGKLSGTAADIDETVARRNVAVGEAAARSTGQLRQAVQVRAGHPVECNIVRACTAAGSKTDNIS